MPGNTYLDHVLSLCCYDLHPITPIGPAGPGASREFLLALCLL